MYGVSNLNGANTVNFRAKVQKADRADRIESVNIEDIGDSVEIQHLKGNRELTKADKQEILSKARAKAAGWSILGEFISTLYYALRSDKTVAKKFDLDPEKDAKFIKKIKRDQVIATLPAVLIPSAGGLAAYIYCKIQDPENIDVK